MEKSALWRVLTEHAQAMSQTQIATLFAQDTARFERFSLSACGILLDFSKQPMTEETLSLLVALAKVCDFTAHADALFSEKCVNFTEHMPALHPLMRDPSRWSASEMDVWEAMSHWVNGLREGTVRGVGGKCITDVVNLGVGGSDLGPKMVTSALHAYRSTAIRCHFVSNGDLLDIQSTLSHLCAETTVFVIASKSFTTAETLRNAEVARSWLSASLGEAHWPKHCIAVTAYPERAAAFGLDAAHMLSMPKALGGRYSLWSALGFVIAVSIGMDGFEALLSGAHAMDMHTQTAPIDQNLPMMLALLGCWSFNFLGHATQALAVYDHALEYLLPYLQQLESESNGKSVGRDHQPVRCKTAPVLWGGVGTNVQHAFFQALHQGTQVTPVDFLIAAKRHVPEDAGHRVLLANMLAQSRALMLGKTTEAAYAELLAAGMDEPAARALAPHKTFSGNRPSNTLMLASLSPKHLGALLALYEHKTFFQSVVWEINPFDQWGVELGKALVHPILHRLLDQQQSVLDGSTEGLIRYYETQQ